MVVRRVGSWRRRAVGADRRLMVVWTAGDHARRREPFQRDRDQQQPSKKEPEERSIHHGVIARLFGRESQTMPCVTNKKPISLFNNKKKM